MLASHRTCCQIPNAAQPRLSEWQTLWTHQVSALPCCQPEEGCAATWQKNHTDTSQELLGHWYHPRKKLSYSECKACLWNSTVSTQNLYAQKPLVTNSPSESCLACYSGSQMSSPVLECITEPLIGNPERSPQPRKGRLGCCLHLPPVTTQKHSGYLWWANRNDFQNQAETGSLAFQQNRKKQSGARVGRVQP